MQLTFERYLLLEEGLESSTTSYDSEVHEAYGSAVLIGLQGVLSMDKQKFAKCYSWASIVFARMILCDDVDVRSCLSQIYITQINPLVSL